MLRLLVSALILLAAPAWAGPATRAAALSGDGAWRAVLEAPDRLVIRATGDGHVGAVFTAKTRAGAPARFEGVYTDPTRRQFVVPLLDAPEYWLIATDPEAPPVYEGLVHSYEAGMIEALPSSEGLFARRRVMLAAPIGRLAFSPDFREMTGLTADGSARVTINLYVNREIARQPAQ